MIKKALSALLLTLVLCLLSAGAFADVPILHNPGEGWTAPYEDVETVTESPFEEGEETLCIDILGIRQGDSIIIRCGGKTMLMDGGEKIRYQGVMYYLEDHGIESFDAFFLTHYHDDHAELQEALMKHGTPIGMIYAPYDETEQAALWREYKKIAAEKEIPISLIKDQDEIEWGGASLRVYRNPELNLSTNDGSAGVMITFGDARIFCGADMTGVTQHWLYDKYAADLKCDILKCFHHGNTPTVTELLDAMSPNLCVITNQKAYTEANDNQLSRRNIARYYINRTIHLETNGKLWYVWTEKMR